MRVNEIFESLQGEGPFAGRPSIFVRLSGCNLNCSWCDSKYHAKGDETTVKEVVEQIKSFKTKHIVISGGEPLLQEGELWKLVGALIGKDYTFEIETNGTIDVDFPGAVFIISNSISSMKTPIPIPYIIRNSCFESNLFIINIYPTLNRRNIIPRL